MILSRFLLPVAMTAALSLALAPAGAQQAGPGWFMPCQSRPQAAGPRPAAAPRQPAPYVNRGLAHAELNREAAALADYDQALRLDPELALAAVNRAALHLRAGRSREAEADLRHALRLDPANAVARQLLAELGAGEK